MKKHILSIIYVSVIVFYSNYTYGQLNIIEAKALISRIIPSHASHFKVEEIKKTDKKDIFEIESVENKIVLRGTNGVSVASALRYYLKNYCHCQLSWNGDQVILPSPLPAVEEKIRKETPYEYRVYLNYTVFSYSMAWWNWERWEKEIDWMAMHGINMPLAVTGQEAVWHNTLKQFNMNDQEIREFLVGPAYFAWQWMTNIEGWGGPLPKSWIDSHIELGQKILQRERELGMTPILQGFTGYVPKLLKEKFPEAKIELKGDWYGVPPGSGQLDPLDPLFTKMGHVFLKEQIKLFGTNHYYAADPFHEGNPPVEGNEYLSKVGKSIYDVAKDIDDKAKIVMQSWSMREPILKAIPKEKILVLDLNSERWKESNSFWDRPWVAGLIHNFGGKSFMGGNLKHDAFNFYKLSKANTGNLRGIGIFPEAIEQNPIVYGLALENVWNRKVPQLQESVDAYLLSRYGKLPLSVKNAWKILVETVYDQKMKSPHMETPINATPALNITNAAPNGGMKREYSPIKVWEAWRYLLEASDTLKGVETYNYDLVDVARQCLADLSIPLHEQITEAYDANHQEDLKKASQEFLELIDDLDELLGTVPDFLFGKWIADAKRWGENDGEKKIYEKNAKMLVTTWGPISDDAVQYDYSNRQWNGLLSDYYKIRWERFLGYLQNQPENKNRFSQDKIEMSYGRPANNANSFYTALSQWQEEWLNTNSSKQYLTAPEGDPVEITQRLYDKWISVMQEAS